MIGGVSSVAGLQRYAVDLAPYRAAGTPAWLGELELFVAPPYLKMGTHALDLDHWFIVDEHYRSELALRARLIDERRDVVFGASPGSDDACAEVLELVSSWLTSRGIDPPATADGGHALERAGRIVQEDLCVMERGEDGWRLTAGVVCFPTFWRLHDKLGRPIGAIHEPVAHYRDELDTRVERFFSRLRDTPVWRRNWGVSPFPLLHLPETEASLPWSRRVGDDGEPLWFRSERQTLRRLPRTGAVLFTIRVQLAPLGAVVVVPGLAERLLAAIESWDDVQIAYKMGMAELRPVLLAYLRRLTGTSTQ
jgi:Haem-dependent oxidative N-demethylase, alpha subunit-like